MMELTQVIRLLLVVKRIEIGKTRHYNSYCCSFVETTQPEKPEIDLIYYITKEATL